jgi:hypothetical protein
MEADNTTFSGSPHSPIMGVIGRGVAPPPPPPSVRIMVVLMPTTSGSGSIPSTNLPTIPSIQNALGAPFSYGMPRFDSNSVLTYSTLQSIGLGVGIYNSPLQGYIMITTSPFNSIPYGGGRIPPPSPSLNGMFQ